MTQLGDKMLKLTDAFDGLRTAEEVRLFLASILSPTELRDVERRWVAIQLSLMGKTQRSIAEAANLSLASATRAAALARENTIFKTIVGRVDRARRRKSRPAEDAADGAFAYKDSLTDLPNRRAFIERLDSTVAEAKKLGSSFAVMIIDIDSFKMLNDKFGHAAGDEVLSTFALRLKQVAGQAFVARYGGDEFAAIIPSDAQAVVAEVLAQKFVDAVTEMFTAGGLKIQITGTIGIAMFPSDGTDANALISKADVALYHGKELARGNWRFASEAENRSSVQAERG